MEVTYYYVIHGLHEKIKCNIIRCLYDKICRYDIIFTNYVHNVSRYKLL